MACSTISSKARRRFVAGLAGCATIPLLCKARAATFEDHLSHAKAAGETRVVIGGGTGAYLDVVRKHFYDPFTKATGIEVKVVGGPYGERIGKLKAMNAVNAVEWDVISMPIDELTPATKAMLRDLADCRDIANAVASGIKGACVGHGVLFDIGAGVLAYDKRPFPNGGPRNWSEFWDVRKFPGPRAFPNMGTPWWVMIAALLADGVKRENLFPLDQDRAFRKLEVLKPHITVWWTSGDQSQQIFRNGEVVMAMLFSGRAERLRAEGFPLNSVWDGAILDAAVWAPVKNAPHPNAALALLDFVYTRPQVHVAYMQEQKASTALRTAVELMSPSERADLVVSPENWDKVINIDPAWLAANRDEVLKRWTKWISA